jgi:hypothetical protein
VPDTPQPCDCPCESCLDCDFREVTSRKPGLGESAFSVVLFVWFVVLPVLAIVALIRWAL